MVKEKSRRKADSISCIYITAALIFKVNVFSDLHKQMTTYMYVVADVSLDYFKRFPMNLPHLPTSAYSHPDIIVHIQAVHQLQVHLMHNLSQA